jgi:hypothetical protein
MSSTPPPPAENLPGPDPREIAASAPEAETEAEATPSNQRPELTVVIEDEASRQKKQVSLVEAAAAERERRAKATTSTVVVTDKNLGEFRDGQLTEMRSAPAPAQSAPAPAAVSAEPVGGQPPEITIAESDPEAYWRGRVLRARMNWASAVEEARHLEGKIAELRQRFYAEEDPYYRDSQIKPSWDRALDRLEEARAAIDRFRAEVQTIVQEGRRASALPGWLREGIELEPAANSDRRESGTTPAGEYRPGEPTVAADPDGESK